MKINRILLIALTLIAPLTAATTQKRPTVTLSKSEISTLENQLINAINDVRKKHKLPPLRPWKALTTSARTHSENMAKGKVPPGHAGFEKRASDTNRIAPLKSFGENVAFNRNYPDPLKEAVNGWMNSPGHRDNILSPYIETGIGIALAPDGGYYFTQLFATRL